MRYAQRRSGDLCTRCRATLYRPGSAASPPPQAIPNYLVQSILVTLCCCLIPGVVGIVYAAQVNARMRAGEFEAARRCSRLANVWCWVGFGLGLACGLAYAVIVLIGMAR
ncbi:MAG TPA: CD225/dispanin family protein [Candidatus Polarisedimenticolaceae bacterium]|nr:CD225/dispanin family protein [Candidatus Polarisedimenticolaceae bacterium]